MTDFDPRCCCRTHGQRLCPLHQPLHLDTAALIGAALSILLALWLCVILTGCGGSAGDRAEEPFGWECEGFSGLTARDAEYFEVCSCAGIELAGDGVGRGECVRPLTD